MRINLLRFSLTLSSEKDTLALGAALARALLPLPIPRLLLKGPLGAGKTTLVRGLTAALPGGDQAEVASPSFNIVNLYPTRPETAHFDLYRLEHMGLDDDLLELLEDVRSLALVEWPEHLGNELTPEHRIEVELAMREQGGRTARLIASSSARKWLESVTGELYQRGYALDIRDS